MTSKIEKDQIVLLLSICSISMMVFSLLYHLFLPISYMFLAAISGLLVVNAVYKKGSKPAWFVILPIFMVYVCLRNLYNIASVFSILPFSDGYGDYVLARVFMENGNLVLSYPNMNLQDAFGKTLHEYSGWPLLSLITISFSWISGIDLLHTAIMLPLLTSICPLLFSFILIKAVLQGLGIHEDSNVRTSALLIALLLFTASSDNIYYSMTYTEQMFGLSFFTVLLYFLYRETTGPTDRRFAVLGMLFLLCLVLSHHLSSFTILLYSIIELFLLNPKILSIIKSKISLTGNKPMSFSFTFVALVSVLLFAWWIFYANPVWDISKIIFGGLGTFSPLYIQESWQASVKTSYYRGLIPGQSQYLLYARDLGLYGFAILGFFTYIIAIIRKKNKLTASGLFVLSSTFAFGLLTLFYLYTVNLEPFRLLFLCLPYPVVFSAYFHIQMLLREKFIVQILSRLLLVIIFFVAFLAPFTHSYFPLYLYAPSVRFEDVGTHNKLYLSTRIFVKNYISLKSYDVILADDHTLLYIIVPIEGLSKVRNLYTNPELIGIHKSLVFEFIHLNPYFHMIPGISEESLENAQVYKNLIGERYNVILDAYYYKIRI